MKHPREKIGRIAGETGFRPEHVEKVLWLMDLLDALMRHPFLDGKVALKGGTALNLFYYPLPRLSVDIDLNYVASPEREQMLADKPLVEKAVEGVCQRLGLSIRRQPTEHAGGKWSLRHPSVMTQGGNLDLDVNFLLRVPLWPTSLKDSVLLGADSCRGVQVLDMHELAAGKLAALFSRSAPRDVFDSVEILDDSRIEDEKLRLGFIAYGAMSRKDWREVRIEDIVCDRNGFRNEVSVLLPGPAGAAKMTPEAVEARCRVLAGQRLLPLRDNEREFLRLINDEGVIEPGLIATADEMKARLSSHPGLRWKAENVRKHRGLPEA